MKQMMIYTAAAVLMLSAQAVYAGDCEGGSCSSCASGHCNHKCSCMEGEYCPKCTCPCDHCRLPSLCGPGHCQCLIDELLTGPDCCARIKAAKKLGCQLHADFCKCPELLPALIKALFCDTCWEVRRAAALAIAHQGAYTCEGVVAVYIASKLDHHYMVRDGATLALDQLTLCRYACFKDAFKAADRVIPRIRKDYDPTNCKCVPALVAFCSQCNSGASEMPMVEPGKGLPKGEAIPAPKEEAKDKDKGDVKE
jgi:hypothetical protein